jgi:hypothetical protein
MAYRLHHPRGVAWRKAGLRDQGCIYGRLLRVRAEDSRMNFEDTVRRIRNMRSYGMNLKEVHDTLAEDGVPEEIIFFAYKGAEQLDEETL